jgi:hypothetical protein
MDRVELLGENATGCLALSTLREHLVVRRCKGTPELGVLRPNRQTRLLSELV